MPECSLDDCAEPATRSGLCKRHHKAAYMRTYSAGNDKPPCTVEGCPGRQYGRSPYCQAHYVRLRQTGSLGTSLPHIRSKSVVVKDADRIFVDRILGDRRGSWVLGELEQLRVGGRAGYPLWAGLVVLLLSARHHITMRAAVRAVAESSWVPPQDMPSEWAVSRLSVRFPGLGSLLANGDYEGARHLIHRRGRRRRWMLVPLDAAVSGHRNRGDTWSVDDEWVDPVFREVDDLNHADPVGLSELLTLARDAPLIPGDLWYRLLEGELRTEIDANGILVFYRRRKPTPLLPWSGDGQVPSIISGDRQGMAPRHRGRHARQESARGKRSSTSQPKSRR